MKNVYFDIETGPIAEGELERVKPVFQAPGNYKKPEAIQENIAEQERSWKERAALSAVTGQVLAVGLGSGLASFNMLGATHHNAGRFEGQSVTLCHDEALLLNMFWDWMEIQLNSGAQIIGFGVFYFDLPFMERRSWKLGAKVPYKLHTVFRGRRYWSEQIIDIAEVWACGNREQKVSLDQLSKMLGVGEKNGDGADFAKLWLDDPIKACQYLKNDVELLRKCSDKILGTSHPVEEPLKNRVKTASENT